MNGWIVTNPGIYTAICILCGAAIAVVGVLIGWIMGDHTSVQRHHMSNPPRPVNHRPPPRNPNEGPEE